MNQLRYFLVILLGGLLTLPMGAMAQTCMTDSAPATTAHLVDNHDGTVSDSKTGLMWKQCPEGQSGADCSVAEPYSHLFDWQQALQQAETVNNSGGFAGYSDWRLPNIKELESIIERQCNDPSINLTAFPNSTATYEATTMEFLSSTPFLVHGFRRVWVAGFASGYVSSQGAGYWAVYKVRLVRNQNL